MKKFAVREMETLKTTAAMYGEDCWCGYIGDTWVVICNADNK